MAKVSLIIAIDVYKNTIYGRYSENFPDVLYGIRYGVIFLASIFHQIYCVFYLRAHALHTYYKYRTPHFENGRLPENDKS